MTGITKINLAIFDLDGVIVSTDECHYRAWKSLADRMGFAFDRELNHELRGVSRAESLKIILKANGASVSEEEFASMLDEKNGIYRKLLEELGPGDILPGVLELLDDLKASDVPAAIGSSSRNTPLILEKIGLADAFDAVVDGNAITRSKPHPEVFLKGAEALSIPPGECVVFEDAQSGVDAAVAAGMRAIGVGNPGLTGADAVVDDLRGLTAKAVIALLEAGRN